MKARLEALFLCSVIIVLSGMSWIVELPTTTWVVVLAGEIVLWVLLNYRYWLLLGPERRTHPHKTAVLALSVLSLAPPFLGSFELPGIQLFLQAGVWLGACGLLLAVPGYFARVAGEAQESPAS